MSIPTIDTMVYPIGIQLDTKLDNQLRVVYNIGPAVVGWGCYCVVANRMPPAPYWYLRLGRA